MGRGTVDTEGQLLSYTQINLHILQGLTLLNLSTVQK